MAQNEKLKRIPALKVHQWLDGWNSVEFAPKKHRSKPQPHFYMFTLSAQELRSLSGIARRQASKVSARAGDLGIQRQHDEERSEEIERFVEFGFPWSTLSERKRQSEEFNDLRKPGWLPTAIVINILKQPDERYGQKVDTKELISITENNGTCEITLPYSKWSANWQPKSVPPLEVIDGQHRLWSFGKNSKLSNFELPVIAFYGLDISWQAYLFYTINIKPKRINPSLAFDLYPLLRAEDWLDRAEGHAVYRETRCQELTEALWSHENSPWYDKINMLGEKKNRWVTQSAWIKSLMTTMVKPWSGRGNKIGGLYGARQAEDNEPLGWSRAQQAAFLIFSWSELRKAIQNTDASWKKKIVKDGKQGQLFAEKNEPGFYSEYSLLTTDQGVRGFLHVLNDVCFLGAARLKLNEWHISDSSAATDADAVTIALKSLNKQPVAKFIRDLTDGLATFDWRTSASPSLTLEERKAKLIFRGSSGYKELRAELLEHLRAAPGDIAKIAERLV